MERLTKEQLESLYTNDKKKFNEWSLYYYNNDRRYYNQVVRPIIKCRTNAKMSSRTSFIIAIGVLIVLIICCVFISRNIDTNKEKVTEEVKNKSDKNIEVVFDVPSLIGKNIDQIKKILGKPDEDSEPTRLQMKQGATIWHKNFTKDGYELLVMYNPQTRKVKDFFIPTTDPSEKTDDYSDLLKVGNLVENDNDYTVRPIITWGDANYYTGIQIREK